MSWPKNASTFSGLMVVSEVLMPTSLPDRPARTSVRPRVLTAILECDRRAERGELPAAASLELREQRRHVALDRPPRNVQALREFGVRKTCDEQATQAGCPD